MTLVGILAVLVVVALYLFGFALDAGRIVGAARRRPRPSSVYPDRPDPVRLGTRRMTRWTTDELAARIAKMSERLETVERRLALLEVDATEIVDGMGKLEARLPGPEIRNVLWEDR